MLVCLSELPNPLASPPWTDCAPIEVSEVEAIGAELRLSPEFASRGSCSRAEHIRRIAWFVAHSDSKPITVLRSWAVKWPVKDGNHRLAAAIIRGDKEIEVNIR